MPKLGCSEEHGETELLNGGIIDLRKTQITAEVEDSLFPSGIVVLREEATDGLVGRRNIQLERLTALRRDQDRWVCKGNLDLRERRLVLFIPHELI
ncbi:hypothetical protein ACFX1S_026960 [Malus domestica]